jgi:hypothetical protein
VAADLFFRRFDSGYSYVDEWELAFVPSGGTVAVGAIEDASGD